MATRSGVKAKTEVKTELLPGYKKRAEEHAKKNLELLSSCGVMSVSEVVKFREMLTEAYVKAGKTSGPVINMNAKTLLGFLRDGVYKGYGESGTTNGTADKELRSEYSKRTYGYETLESAEKYGTVPLIEVNPNGPLKDCPFCKYPGSRYGEIQVHLNSDVKLRSTINLLDSGHQWGLDGSWKYNSCGLLFPVPYVTEEPTKFVGCLIAAPTCKELEALKESGPRRDMFASNIRRRNLALLELLRGNDATHYVEAHIHGTISLKDIAHVVYDPHSITDLNEWAEIAKLLADAVGIRPITYLEELRPNIF